MKLYYAPGTCALSPHIVLREAGIRFDPVRVSTKTHTLADGSDFYAINPKGYVPVLELDNGERLTEGPAIVQYIADHAPASGLAPAAGTMARYRLMEWLNFISTEVHKQFSPLFNAAMPEEAKKLFADKIRSRLQWVDRQIDGCDYLMGERFCVADAYLFTVTNWARHVGISLDDLPNVVAWRARVAARPAVQEAMQVESAK
jgi:glutathione S-transferase